MSDNMGLTESGGGEYTYARFWRCALQVNTSSYKETYRGKGHGFSRQAYLEALLRICQEEGIEVVGIADHGSVADVDSIREHLRPNGIVVFPGFEVSTTEKVHWVCLFPENTSTEQLDRFLGSLELTNPQDGVTPSKLGGDALLSKVETFGGICYAAHATGASGLLKEKKPHLWQDPRLKAAQIPGAIKDLPQEYKPIALNKNPDYFRERPLAIINAKDVAVPEDLRDPSASCHIKMTRPCFESFLMAFKDPESRIRLQHEMEERYYSSIEHISIEGGYLDGLEVRISEHLNTVIGGRGTGKSTLLESLRYALDQDHKGADAKRQGEQVLKENLGKAHSRIRLELVSAAQNMNRYTVVRRYGEPPRVIDADGNESSLQPIDLLPAMEIYGQNEIYELAKNEGALIQVLNRFLPDQAEHKRQLAGIHKRLRDNAQRLVKARDQREELEEKLAKLPKLKEQVKQFKTLGLEEKLKQVPLLEKERQLRPRLQEELDRMQSGLGGFWDTLPDLVFLSDKALEGLPHADRLRRGRETLEKAKATVEQHIGDIEKAIEAAGKDIGTLASDLEQLQKDMEDRLEKQFAKLPEVAGKSGKDVGRTYQALLRQIEAIRPQQSRVETVDKLLETLRQERRNLLGELSDLRSARTRALEKAAKKLNRKLKGKLRVQVIASGNRGKLKEFLRQLPGIGEGSVSWVDDADGLTIPALVEALKQGPDELQAKGWGVTRAKAETICRMDSRQRLDLETVDLEDRPVLELNVAHKGENYRPLERLSTGQQCTAILHVLLLDNPDPLIMDQPEDNLDNAFIADRIVQELRSAKTERQFIFATHNANIPVFGDAEWIGVFEATEDHGEMPLERQGSIDVPAIRDDVSRILEGGRDAFIQRKEKYGY